jgi:hypothetical protein
MRIGNEIESRLYVYFHVAQLTTASLLLQKEQIKDPEQTQQNTGNYMLISIKSFLINIYNLIVHVTCFLIIEEFSFNIF